MVQDPLHTDPVDDVLETDLKDFSEDEDSATDSYYAEDDLLPSDEEDLDLSFLDETEEDDDKIV